MDTKQIRRSNKEYIVNLRFLENLPPDFSWYMLPRDFTPEEWATLSNEEKLGSTQEDCERLKRIVHSLERKVLQTRFIAFGLLMTIFALIYTTFSSMR